MRCGIRDEKDGPDDPDAINGKFILKEEVDRQELGEGSADFFEAVGRG